MNDVKVITTGEVVTIPQQFVCNTCGGRFDNGEVSHQSAKDRKFLATKSPRTGAIIQECCDGCAQDAVAPWDDAA